MVVLCYKRTCESVPYCLILDFNEEDFNLSMLRIMLAINLFYMDFLMPRYIPSTSNLLRVSSEMMLNFFMSLTTQGKIKKIIPYMKASKKNKIFKSTQPKRQVL